MKRSALAIACLLVACPSSHETRERAEQSAGEAGVYYQGDGPFAPVTEEEFGEALGAALLQEMERCCQQLELPFERAADRLTGLPQAFIPADPSSGARYRPAAAAACLTSYETRACPRSKDAPTPPAENPCQALYQRGTRRTGEPCVSSWDCATDGPDSVPVCTGNRGAASCAMRRVLQQGDACSSSDPSAQCAPQLFCDPARSACVPRAMLGQPCLTGPSFGDTCVVGAVCDRRNTRRCVRARAVGASCGALEECEDLACVDGACREPLAAHSVCEAARPGPLRR